MEVHSYSIVILQLLLFNWSLSLPQGSLYGSSSELPISRLSVKSHITLRYAQTEVESQVKNPDKTAKEVKFSMFLPDSAFISNFSMTIGESEHVAKVLEKKAAVEEYNNAKQLGIGAGLVSQNERDSNQFSITTNVEGGQKVVFLLKYDELLERRNGKYEHAIHINPEGIIEDLKVEVFINESLPISSLFIPEMNPSNELGEASFGRKPESKDASVTWDKGSSEAHIVYAPDEETQRAAGNDGVSGQFVVTYDVDRKGQDSEVQVIDGYFVHFFAPDKLEQLPKHAVFVLDISGSMMGEKIVQLKDAMFTILDEMTDQDFFSIIVFSSQVTRWTSPKLQNSDKDTLSNPFVIDASEHNKNIAIDYINSLNEGGGTAINDAMLEGIDLAEEATKQEVLPGNTKSMVIFLTDGQPTIGERNGLQIRQNVKSRNMNKIPIFCLAFGRDSDFSLMKEISLEADSFAKMIYDGSDAAIQLEDFYSQIASPLISDLKFQYLGELVENSSVSKADLSTAFKGSEYVVVGKLKEPSEEDKLTIVMIGDKNHGKYEKKIDICLRPRVLPYPEIKPLPAILDSPLASSINCIPPPTYPKRSSAQNFMQKLHAFVNIKQLLKKEDDKSSEEESPRNKALKLSLANNFVTELTSLVVVDKQDVKIASLGPDVEQSSSFGGVSYSGGISAQSFGISRSAGGGRRRNRGRISHSYSSSGSRSSSRSVSYSLSNSPKVVSHSILQHAQVQSAPMYYDAYNSFDYNPATTTTTYSPLQTSCSGSVTLFTKTYNRGTNITISQDTSDLGTFKLVSLKVTGDCSWEIFTGTNYSGKSKQFTSSGSYLSTTSMGSVFRNAGSVKRC